MRPKLLAVTAACLLAACATPTVRFTPRFSVGEKRVYRLDADIVSTIDAGGQKRSERSEIRGRSTIEVRSTTGSETTLHITLALERFLRDGKPEQHAAQTAEVVVGPDGSVIRVTVVGGIQTDVSGANVEEFARLLSVPLPTRPLRLGDRWTSTLPDGRQTGRLRGFRVEGERDCAVASTTTERAVDRGSSEPESEVLLSGTEVAASEVCFAFREGFAVRIRTDSQGDFQVASPTLAGGTLRITSHSTMTLLRRTV